MSKSQIQVHMDMPPEEAQDFIDSVEDLQRRIEGQPIAIRDARQIATRLKVIRTFADAMKAALVKAG